MERAEAWVAKRLEVVKARWEKEFKKEQTRVVKAFQSLDKFKEHMGEYNIDSYLIEVIDCHTKTEALFSRLDVARLDDETPTIEVLEEVEVALTNGSGVENKKLLSLRC